ncbi:hypothetical protein D3C79_658040 [compost metagenome]
MPAKQATRWMAPATPVFAGAPAPTWAVLASRQVMSMRGGGQWSGSCSQYLHDPLVKRPCVAKSLLSTGRYLASKQAASLQGRRPKPDFQKPARSLWELACRR